ncbi:MAG TPA: divergent polysaccharide deacetylase family protein [Candidatus Omnitrophota bacterium]|nr:divergent polysaccharide deacetylase family protein [Candidatus Omnitrophota bacterium]
MARRRRKKIKNPFKIKIKVNKKRLKKALWVLSIVMAGYLLFLGTQYLVRSVRKPQPASPVITRPTTTTRSPKVTQVTQATQVAQPATLSRKKPVSAVTAQVPPPAPIKLTRPSIVIVIDDIGAHNKLRGEMERLGNKVTYAILPLLPYSRFFSELATRKNAEAILHLPLDTTQDMIPGRGLIVSTMPREQALDMLSRDIASVPGIVGVNNHMGSRGTADREMMTLILEELHRRGLFFLDSYTTKDSVVPSVARQIGIPFLQRGVFLDNVDSPEAIRGQIRETEAVAKKQGYAIAIGHYRKNTLDVLFREIPRLEKKGFAIISLSRLLQSRRR